MLNFAVPADHRIKLKVSEKMEENLNLVGKKAHWDFQKKQLTFLPWFSVNLKPYERNFYSKISNALKEIIDIFNKE